jgi:hypothetical protein
MMEKGMGRTRLGRLAAVTVPATVASLGLGLAIVQGSVSAALASSGGFQVGSTQAKADGLQLSLANATSATASDNTTVKNNEAALVTLENGKLDGMCLAANTTVPVLGVVGLKISVPNSTSGGSVVDVGTLDLNAKSVAAGTTSLPGTTVGVAEDDLRRNNPAAYSGLGGFGMQTNNAAGETPGDVSLSGLNATAYMLNLNNGLSLSSLTIAPKLGGETC